MKNVLNKLISNDFFGHALAGLIMIGIFLITFFFSFFDEGNIASLITLVAVVLLIISLLAGGLEITGLHFIVAAMLLFLGLFLGALAEAYFYPYSY